MKGTFANELNSEEIANILNKNFSFEIIEDKKLGTVIKLPPREAIRLSLVHGAPYMFSPTGYSLKGRMEVFVHRSVFQNDKYIYVPGLFGRDRFSFVQQGDSFLSINKQYPTLFQEPKYLIFKSIRKKQSSNIEQITYKELTSIGLKPENYLIFKIYEDNTNMEPFFEYLCCKKFMEMGYITENQVPWFQQSFRVNSKQITGGIPDFAAYKLPFKIVSEGLVIQEFASLFIGDLRINKKNISPDNDYNLFLGEVKLSKNQRDQAYSQLSRYMQTGLPSRAYSIIHEDCDPPLDRFSKICIDENHKIQIQESSYVWKTNDEMIEKDLRWLKNYIKFFLLANCTFDKILNFVKEAKVSNKKRINSWHLIQAVISQSFADTLQFVEENMNRSDD